MGLNLDIWYAVYNPRNNSLAVDAAIRTKFGSMLTTALQNFSSLSEYHKWIQEQGFESVGHVNPADHVFKRILFHKKLRGKR